MKRLVKLTLLTALVVALFAVATPRQAEAHRRWAYYRGPAYYGPRVVYSGPYVAYRRRPILAPRRVWVAPAAPVYYYYGY